MFSDKLSLIDPMCVLQRRTGLENLIRVIRRSFENVLSGNSIIDILHLINIPTFLIVQIISQYIYNTLSLQHPDGDAIHARHVSVAAPSDLKWSG